MLCVLMTALLAGMMAPAASAAEANVLFLSSFGPAVGWTETMLAGIKEGLAAQDRPVKIHFEFLDGFQFPDQPGDEAWGAFLAAKYRRQPPDAIIADAVPAIRFGAGIGRRIFPGVPLIGILPRFDGLGDVADAVTVKVTTGPHIDRTVQMMLEHWPKARKLVIVSDNGELSRHLAGVIRAAAAEMAGSRVEVEHLFDFRLEDLETRLAALPGTAVVLYTHVTADKTGRSFRSDEVAARLARVASVPIYALFDTEIGTGVVGGCVNNPRVAGRAALGAALELIENGGRSSVRAENSYSSQTVVDWRQLRRWKIDEDTLPPDTEVRFRQPSVFEAYFFEILLILAFIVVLAVALVVISALYVQRGRFARALGESNSRLEERVAARTRDLAAASAQTGALLEFSPVPALITDRGRVRMANRRFVSLFGGSLAAVSDFESWWSHAHPDPVYWARLQCEWTARLNAARSRGVPITPMNADVLCHDGVVRNIEIHAVPLEDCLVIQFIDLTERKRMEEELRHLACHDSLTRLPNRRLLLDRLDEALKTGREQGQYGAVLFLDLDNFKSLNDRYGHDIGDMLLVEVAGRLLTVARESDTVARLGGDEFVVLLEGLGSEPEPARAHAAARAEMIRRLLAREYRLGGVCHQGSVSIGIKIFRGGEGDSDQILKESDSAMYEAKKLRLRTAD
jgi:diguanylate cyclase (GGDEF)-like protein